MENKKYRLEVTGLARCVGIVVAQISDEITEGEVLKLGTELSWASDVGMWSTYGKANQIQLTDVNGYIEARANDLPAIRVFKNGDGEILVERVHR